MLRVCFKSVAFYHETVKTVDKKKKKSQLYPSCRPLQLLLTKAISEVRLLSSLILIGRGSRSDVDECSVVAKVELFYETAYYSCSMNLIGRNVSRKKKVFFIFFSFTEVGAQFWVHYHHRLGWVSITATILLNKHLTARSIYSEVLLRKRREFKSLLVVAEMKPLSQEIVYSIKLFLI